MRTLSNQICMVCLTNSNDELCSLLKKMSIPLVCSEHELHQSLSLHGLEVRGLATACQFKAYFPCTRAKPHLHKRHNKTLWLVTLNLWLTAPCWLQGLVMQQLRYTQKRGLSTSCTNTFFFPVIQQAPLDWESASCGASAGQAGTGALLLSDWHFSLLENIKITQEKYWMFFWCKH